MITKKLSLLRDIPNYVSMSQADVDLYKLDDDQIKHFKDSVELFSNRAKSHDSYQYVKFHLDNNFKYFDIVKIPKYPLLAVYNINTKKCLINISASLKTNVNNIDARDLYTMVCYAHCVSCLTMNSIDVNNYEYFCNYICLMMLKLFAKKYGITGSYVDLIPQFKYVVSVYVLMKFFGLKFSEADKKAKAFSKFDSNILYKRIKPDNYNLNEIKDMLRMLDDGGICPGFKPYRFLETIIKYYNVMGLSMFEDIMRFCSALFCASINSNSYFPQIFQLAYSKMDYDKIFQIIEKKL
jgi:hypothetical protein